MITNSEPKYRPTIKKHRLSSVASLALLTAASMVSTSTVNADIVLATYSIQASDFISSNNNPPPAPTSNQFGGVLTFMYNTQIIEQLELVPEVVSGFSMTDNDGHLIQYDEVSTGVNARTYIAAGNDNHRIIFGGKASTVATMTGLSEDFRVSFDVSSVDYTVEVISSPLSFITTADAYYTAQTMTISLLGTQIVSDVDGDNISDATDNCINVSNADQRDTNGDNLGNVCDPDFNQDCQVNFIDLSIFGGNFLLPGDLDTDLNGDGVTNFVDLSVLTNYMFGPPGPSALNNTCL